MSRPMPMLRMGSTIYQPESGARREREDQHAGHDDADGAEEVGHHVLERSFRVQAFSRRAVEHIGRRDIDEQTRYADAEQQRPLDLGRLPDRGGTPRRISSPR